MSSGSFQHFSQIPPKLILFVFSNAIFSYSSTSNGFRFSRICPICSDSPLHRAVFTSCGHSICLACAEEIKLVAEESEEVDLACPMCREEGEFVKLWEQRLEQDST